MIQNQKYYCICIQYFFIICQYNIIYHQIYKIQMYVNKSLKTQNSYKQKLRTENTENFDNSFSILENSFNINVNDHKNKLFQSKLNTSQKIKSQEVEKIKLKYSSINDRKQKSFHDIIIDKPLNRQFTFKQIVKDQEILNKIENRFLDDEVKILKKQNQFLKNEIKKLQYSYNQLLGKQIERKESDMNRKNKQGLQKIKKQYEQEIEGKTKKILQLYQQIQNYKNKQIHIQKYIQNLEKTNNNLESQILNNKKQLQNIPHLQKLIQQANAKNILLQQNIKEKDQQFNITVNQIAYQNQNRNSSHYLYELQKNNTMLIKQNKRLSQLIIDRARSGFKK